MPVCVLTDQERQLEVRKVLEQALVPMRRALGTRWLICSVVSDAWITKSHGKDCNSRFIVEDRAVQLQPVPETIAARITPRYPALMDFAPRRLTNDQKPGGSRQLHNGSRTERQIGLADPTRSNFAQYTCQ